MSTIIKIKTWRCSVCDYSQDYEPTKVLHTVHFPGMGLGDGECPACGTGQAGDKTPNGIKRRNKDMIQETDPKKKTTITIKDEADVDLEIDKDENISLALKPAEKEKRKQIIRDAIAKFKLLEDK